MTPSYCTLSTLIRAMFPGPWLTVEYDSERSDCLEDWADALESRVDLQTPALAIARSWHAVAHGAEAFDEDLLEQLRDAEPVIREHFPQDRHTLGINLAAQGCHIWFLHDRADAIRPLTEAFDLLMGCGSVLAADLVKIAEVLADCQSSVGDIEDALCTLYAVRDHVDAAYEQDEFVTDQYEEFRGQFIDEFGDSCLPESAFMVDALRLPRRWLVTQSQSANAGAF